MLQVPALKERFAPGTRLKLASLVLGGAFLGLRLAWADNPVVAAGAIAGVLGLLGLLRGGIALASRRRVARIRASWPGSAAVSASVNVAAMMAPGSLPTRRRIEIFTATVLLLPDRLILVPGWWRARRGGIAELHLPLDHVRSASWLTDDAVLRQIPVLQLTGESGDPVMIRFGVGPHQATADFIAATRATLARWLPAAALTGNTSDPVNPTHLLGVGVPLVVAAMVVSIMGGYFAGAVVITRAKSSPTLSNWIRPDRAIDVPGYYTYGGPHRKPIQLGAPFGRPCKPIVVRFEDSVPAAPYQSFVDVVQEAHAAGVNITITERNGAFLFSQLYPPGQRLDTVQIVAVFADKETPRRLTSGTLEHFSFGWDAVLAEDGRHEYVTDVNIKLHLSSMGGDASAFREAALGFVGFTQGIAVSTAPGSAFAAGYGSGADKFSARDIDAMLTMSGCPPTSHATHAPSIPPG